MADFSCSTVEQFQDMSTQANFDADIVVSHLCSMERVGKRRGRFIVFKETESGTIKHSVLSA